MTELALRFLAGGVIVSLFAVCGEVLKPKTFAGVFGSAPSVALATLGLTFATHDQAYVATECRAMIVGSVALIAYCATCVALLRSGLHTPVWRIAAMTWSVWFATSFVLWSALQYARVLP
ncbi:MAG TPA: DUF3147 family protein [Candidatus Binatia bacterium]|jgi:hypothetical protein